MNNNAELFFALANFEGKRKNAKRLDFLRSELDEEFKLCAHSPKTLNRSLQDKIPLKSERCLLFIHLTPWPTFNEDVQEWSEKFRNVSCIVAFSGGGLSKEEENKLLDVAKKVKMAGRVKVFRGVFPPESPHAVLELRELYQRFKNCAELDPPNWDEFEQFTFQDETQAITSAFATLNVLIQGYLVVRCEEALPGNDYQPYMQGLGILLNDRERQNAWTKTQFETTQKQRLFRPTSIPMIPCDNSPVVPADMGWYWFDECLNDIGKWHMTKVCAVYPALKQASSLAQVLRLIRGESLGADDGLTLTGFCSGWSQNDVTLLLKRAYREYLLFLDEEKESAQVIKLDEERNRLNYRGDKETLAKITREQEIPNHIFVCSENYYWAIAMQKVLSAFSKLIPHIVPSVDPKEIAPNIHFVSMGWRGNSDATCLIRYTTELPNIVTKFIDSLFCLRNTSYSWNNRASTWTGPLIAVVPSKNLANKVNEAKLFGAYGKYKRFRDLPGHKCLPEPLCIPTLIDTIAQSGYMGSYTWNELLTTDPLLNLLEIAQRGLSLAESEKNALFSACQELQNRSSKIEWKSIAMHTETGLIINNIVNSLLPDTVEAMYDFLGQAKSILTAILRRRGVLL